MTSNKSFFFSTLLFLFAVVVCFVTFPSMVNAEPFVKGAKMGSNPTGSMATKIRIKFSINRFSTARAPNRVVRHLIRKRVSGQPLF